mgnify:CR=1 FL=1
MIQIQAKRVYENEDKSDGFRILVDRLWPRGIKKENLHYDLWEKEIAPSTQLRQWFHSDETKNWDEFRKKYIQELDDNPETETFVRTVKNHKKVTLLYALNNTEQNHADILKEYLENRLR